MELWHELLFYFFLIKKRDMNFEEIKKHIKKFNVGIAGAGGLGSNAAVALARTGIGKIIVVDFDSIDESNLNRQYYFVDQIGMPKVEALKQNIQRINPACTVETHQLKIDEGNIYSLFSNCSVIIEAFDLAETKKMLIETVLTQLPETHIISGSGMAGWGKTDEIRQRKIEKLYLCGDEKSEISEENPPLAPRVGIVANMQANICLEILLKMKE
jgi:sulfur carrier protein ThiS adenylyltransferase